MKFKTVSDGHSHSIIKDGKKHTWYVKNLWKLTENFSRFDYNVSSFNGFDEDFWFGDRIKPTIKKIIEHHQKIMTADMSYPIIISEEGLIMDGVHRICRAYLENIKTIRAVQFEKNPIADIIK